jgi:hypothetical protein
MLIRLAISIVLCLLFVKYVVPFPFVTSQALTTPPPPTKARALYFTGAGIYIWWQIGAARYIQERCDRRLLQNIPVVGASAGSITATMLLTNADSAQGAKFAEKLAYDYEIFSRDKGLYGIWGELLREWLDEVIKDDSSLDSLKNLYISITPSLGMSKLVTGFEGKADLIEAIMASCHVPMFLDGKPFASYKGEAVLDGSFWYFVTKNRFTGLPFPENIPTEEVLWVDYGDDEEFMNSINGNFLGLITPEAMYEMIEAGYNHMKREDYYRRLPLGSRRMLPNVQEVRELLARSPELLSLLPEEVRGIPKRIRIPKFALKDG